MYIYQLYRLFRNGETPPEKYGRDRDYAIDLIPKFGMASGEFVQFLVHTDVTRYLEFKQISGSYVYKGGKISKVPANEMEALASPLLGFWEKRRMQQFLKFISTYKEGDLSTHQGTKPTRSLISFRLSSPSLPSSNLLTNFEKLF